MVGISLGIPNTANVALFKETFHTYELNATHLVNGEHYTNPVQVSAGYWWAVDLVRSYKIGTITLHSGGGRYITIVYQVYDQMTLSSKNLYN